jgi:hypothetical protein
VNTEHSLMGELDLLTLVQRIKFLEAVDDRPDLERPAGIGWDYIRDDVICGCTDNHDHCCSRSSVQYLRQQFSRLACSEETGQRNGPALI